MVGSSYGWDTPLRLHLHLSVQSSSKTQLFRSVLQSGPWWVLVMGGTPHSDSTSTSVYSPHLRPSYLGWYYSLARGGFWLHPTPSLVVVYSPHLRPSSLAPYYSPSHGMGSGYSWDAPLHLHPNPLRGSPPGVAVKWGNPDGVFDICTS